MQYSVHWPVSPCFCNDASCSVQERTAFRNFNFYANNVLLDTQQMPHNKVSSWAWYSGHGSPLSATIPEGEDGVSVDWLAVSSLTAVPNAFLRWGASGALLHCVLLAKQCKGEVLRFCTCTPTSHTGGAWQR